MSETIFAQALQLPIEMYGIYPGQGQYGVRIKRFDDLLYDSSSKTFKPESQITNPFIPIVQGTGNDQTLLSVKIPLDPNQFADGDYRIYVHQTDVPTKMIVSEVEVQIWNGTWISPKPLTTADLSDLATKTDVASLVTTADLSDLVSKLDVSSLASKTDISNLATRTDTASINDALLQMQSSFPTDVASRIMIVNISAHKKVGTLGALLNKMGNQLDYVCDYIQSQTGKPKPIA